MTTLFDQRQAWDIELYNVAKENREEGKQEGLQEGKKEGLQEGQANLIKTMLKMASIAEISKLTGIPQDEVERLANS